MCLEGETEEARKLMKGEWRNSAWAEYVKVLFNNGEGLDRGGCLGSWGILVRCWCRLGGCRPGSRL